MRRRLRQLPESLLAKLWQARAARHRRLTTLDGRHIRVLYAGRLSAAAGPDFRDAMLEVAGGGVIKGDVEIHRRQRDWQSHGHHRDPYYDGVVLHAALKTSGPTVTPLASGETSPVVSLEPLLDEGKCDSPGTDPWSLLARHGYRRPKDAEGMGRLLDQAGDQRFVWKAWAFDRRLDNEEPHQVLYEALMEALGYSRNRGAFRELARRIPYQELRALAMKHDPSEHLRLVTHVLSQACEGLEWHTFRVRPSNHPHRRVLGAARLLARHMEEGLLQGLAEHVRRGSWRATLDSLEMRDDEGKSLIGRGRASDMAVNAVLPFLHIQGRISGDSLLRDATFQVYREAPKLQENELTHEVRRLLLAPGRERQVNGARRQQGLLHLYRLLTHVGKRPPRT